VNKDFFRLLMVKRTIYLVLTFILVGCSYIDADFVGKWKVYNVEFNSEIRANVLDDEAIEAFRAMEYQLLEDGTVIHRIGAIEAKGTWKLVRKKYLEMKFKHSNAAWGYGEDHFSCKVMRCSGGKLTLRIKFHEKESWTLYLEAQ
jgi:hypothetical protein